MMPLWRHATTTVRAGWPRAERIARISGEATLIAAVALGVAQLAWRVIAPVPAVADIAPFPREPKAPDASLLSDVSPFAPFAVESTGAHTELQAAFDGVEIAGVRLAVPADRSSVVLSLPEGRQRALLVGQEFTAGIVLTHVDADHAEFTFNGQRRDLVYAAANEPPSLALALLKGRPLPEASRFNLSDPASAKEPTGPVAGPSLVSAEPAPRSAAQNTGAQDAEWLAQTLTEVVTRDGVQAGWRAAPNPPQALAQAGLQAGDLIVDVNGHKPGEGAPLFAAGPQQSVSITIERNAGERRVLSVVMDAT